MTAPIEWDDDGPAAVRHVAAGAAVGVAFLFVGGALAFGWTALRAGASDRLFVLVLALALLSLTGRALLAGAAGLWIVAAACRTRGRLDPAAGTFTYGGRTASLAGLDGVRRVPLGVVSVYWLDFARGRVGSGVP